MNKIKKSKVKFISNYSSEDFAAIMFDWNGKYGDELEDPNMKFRYEICEILKEDLNIASDQLIIDLFIELSKCAKACWGVYESYHLFAEEVLRRGSIKYLMIYLEGTMQCFDTILSSKRVRLDIEEKKRIYQYVQNEIKNTNSKSDMRLLEYALKHFKR
ncbi:MAG: hypothetical protein AAGA77_25225 [Bacteroidota bacterium]